MGAVDATAATCSHASRIRIRLIQLNSSAPWLRLPPPSGTTSVHAHIQRDGREVAHGNLVRRGVLDDLRAQVGGLDGAQVLYEVLLGVCDVCRGCAAWFAAAAHLPSALQHSCVNPRTCWFDFMLHASLYSMYGVPVSICASSTANQSCCARTVLRARPSRS